ncbi:MAG: hypothetical protein AAF674_16905 [Pseudomonadota bacterium]
MKILARSPQPVPESFKGVSLANASDTHLLIEAERRGIIRKCFTVKAFERSQTVPDNYAEFERTVRQELLEEMIVGAETAGAVKIVKLKKILPQTTVTFSMQMLLAALTWSDDK